MVVTIRRAAEEDIRALSRKLLALLRNKDSQIYQDNVARFGIPDDYVKKVFSEETLLDAAKEGKATFFLALEGGEIIGFAQIIERDAATAELDRIIVFPERAGRGIGTQLLREGIAYQRRRGMDTIIVNTGREETHARRFYEKNGFRQVQETTLDAPWGKKLTLVTYELRLNEDRHPRRKIQKTERTVRPLSGSRSS